MVQMLREHGLVPVPLELDPKTMAPYDVDSFRKLVSKKVRNFLSSNL